MCCKCDYSYDKETDLMKMIPFKDANATFYFGIETETSLYTENKATIDINYCNNI